MLRDFNRRPTDGDSRPFSSRPYDTDDRSPDFPFTRTELDLWRQFGRRYPIIAAIELAKNTEHPSIAKAIAEESKYIKENDVAGWEQLAIENIRENERNWEPPLDPLAHVSQVLAEISAIEARLEEKLASVQPGIWQSANIKSYKANASLSLSSKRFKASREANDFRNAITTEIDYYLKFEGLDLPSD